MTGTSAGPTLDEARSTARRARAAFEAVGGKVDEAAVVREAVSCADYYTAAAVCWWFAAEATLTGSEHAAWYVGAAQAYETAGAACEGG